MESIFKQGLDENDYEVIIVNDGTPDKSMEMITDIIVAHQNIHVINQENQGLSVARNNGIAAAKGEYIQFLDSDDLLLVVADFIIMNDEQISQINNKPIVQTDGTIQERINEELFTYDLNPHFCFVWNALYKRDFLNHHQLRFIPNIYFEDIPFTHQCYIKANHSIRINWQFIIYRKGHESITSKFSIKKAMDYCEIIAYLWELSKDKGLAESIRQKLRDSTFISFSMLFYFLTTCKVISYSEKVNVLNLLKKDIPKLVIQKWT